MPSNAYAMSQVIIGGYADALNSGATEYNTVSGGYAWSASMSAWEQIVTTPGKIKNLYVELSAAPGAGAGDGYEFTLMVNGVASALTCTVTQPATSASDLVNEVDVVAGDYLSIRSAPQNTPSATPNAQWSMYFTGTQSAESNILGASSGVNTGTTYSAIMQGLSASTGTENDQRTVCPTDGTIKNLYIKLSSSAGVNPDAYRFTLRNGGINTALTVTVTAPATTGSDVVNTAAVSAGDVLTVMVESLNTPATTPVFAAMGMTFVADNDGESIYCSGTNDDLNNANTEYQQILTATPNGPYPAWTATEANVQQLAQVCELTKMYVLLSGSPGVGNDYTFSVRQNAASPGGGLSVNIADAATTGNDVANSNSISNGDNVNIMSVPNSSPNVVDAYWGICGYIAPAAAPTVEANETTYIEENYAYLTGNITDVSGGNATMRGFAWGTTCNSTQPVNEEPPASYTNNWTEEGNWGTGSYSYNVTGLSSATCYYGRSYAYNSNGFGWSATEESWLTKPDPPTGLTCSGANATVNLSWTNASCGAGNTCNTYIRYNTGTYPANVTDGTESYNGTGVNTSQGGLVNGTTYYFRAWTWVTGCGESKYSDLYDECSATPAALVVVDTLSATLVEENDAQLSANITDLSGAANADMRGFAWGPTCNSTMPSNETPPASYASNWTDGGTFAVGDYSHNITGLSEGTCYCYRGFAHTTTGYGWGDEVSFLTKPDEPNTLVCTPGDGQVVLTWTKGDGADNTYIRYKAGSYPDNVTDGTLSYNGTGVTTTQGGLANGTTYYFRAWSWSVGCNDNLDEYSDLYDECFATPSTVLVQTDSCTGFGHDWAIINGTVLDLGGGTSITSRGFQYGLTTAYGDTETDAGAYGLGVFASTLNNLAPATVYHYRAFAINNNGVTGYGEDRVFATKGSPTPYEYWNTGGDSDSTWIYGSNWTYQTFTTNTTDIPHSITSIKLSMMRVGSPGDVTVSVRRTSNCTALSCYCWPTGADLVTATLDGDAFGTSYTWHEFEVDDFKCFSENTTYAIVVRAIGGDTSNYVLWEMDSGGGYTGGNAGDSADSGVTWDEDCPADFLFEIWGEPCLAVDDAKVFTSYIDDGDWLITLLYTNFYPPYYEDAEDVSSLFYIQLINGTTVEAQSRVFDWGYRPGCLYLSASEVESLEWGASYYVRMWGNFGENPYAEYALQGADWMGSDLNRLDSWVRSTASLMETYYGVTLTEYIQGKGVVLNEDGGVIFATNIPELDAVRPHIFEIVSEDVGWEEGEFTHTYAHSLSWQTLVGPQLTNAFTSLGEAFSLEGSTMGAVIGFVVYALVAFLAFPPGHAIAAIVLPSPLLLFVWGSGLAELALMGILLAVAIILFIWQFWWKGA